MLPDALHRHLKDHTSLAVTESEPLAGGSINRAAKLTTDRGSLFLKWNRSAPADMFKKEAWGLELLRSADTGLYIPEVIDFHADENEVPGFLLMEFIEPNRGSREAAHNFGQQLAKLHDHTDSTFGLSHDNYIGRLPQSNRNHPTWVGFFIHERIEPQLKMAIDSGLMEPAILQHWERLKARLSDLFPETRPCLLHGDLWGGNYFFDYKSRTVLIDPAVYYGHPEMELSFTKMFGGFSDPFYDAYANESPLEPGFSGRVPVYNLYPLLVHVNLFGGHYASQARSLLKGY